MSANQPEPVHVVGGGLAGSEAAWQIARAGVPVVLHEMRPERGTEAHVTDGLAELVCSNSFRSDDASKNALGTLYNMVGFQTKLKYGEQTRIFRAIPGLEAAAFARLGGLHRNTFINSPELLDNTLRLKALPRLRFAGQITGVEGYVESAAIGLIAGRFAAAERLGRAIAAPPPTTAHGALLGHITGEHLPGARIEPGPRSFQPMNVNFGLFPPIAVPEGQRVKRKERKPALAARALADLEAWSSASAMAAA